MTAEPLIVELEVATSAAQAFQTWTARCAMWWPRSHTVSGDPAAITFEPRAGGAILERARDGEIHRWGEILDWEPPARLRYRWHLFFAPEQATEVEVTFTETDTGTVIRLEQRGFERLGDVGPDRRERTGRAWASIVERFAEACRAAGLDGPGPGRPGDDPDPAGPDPGPLGVVIAVDDPRADDVRALLAVHLTFAKAQTPREDAHAMEAHALADPAITFVSARRDGTLLAVGALRELDSAHGEIKSMHTLETARGQGVARALLGHLIALARARDYRRVSLETGSHPTFSSAHRLYAAAGFVESGPFGDYRESPHSVYLTLAL